MDSLEDSVLEVLDSLGSEDNLDMEDNRMDSPDTVDNLDGDVF